MSLQGYAFAGAAPAIRVAPRVLNVILPSDINGPNSVGDIKYNNIIGINNQAWTRTYGKSFPSPKQAKTTNAITVYNILCLAWPWVWQNTVTNPSIGAKQWRLLYEQFKNNKIPIALEYYIARMMSNGALWDKLKIKLGNNKQSILQFAKLLQCLNAVHLKSFFILNKTTVENGVYHDKWEKFSPTNQLLLNYKLDDTIADSNGGYAWRDDNIKLNIVELVGTA